MTGSEILLYCGAGVIGLLSLFAVAKIYEIVDILKEIRDKKV